MTASYFLGNGALLEGISTALPSVANIDIIGNVTAPGNVSVAGKLDVTGNVTADYYFGNIAFASGGAEASIPSAIFADVTGNVTAPGNVIVAGQVNVTGNVTASYFLGNGALLEGVATALPSVANIDVRGNIIGNYADVANVTAIVGNIGNVKMSEGIVTAPRYYINDDTYSLYTTGGYDVISFDSNNARLAYDRANDTLTLTVASADQAQFNATGNLTLQGSIIAPEGNIGNTRFVEGGNVTASYYRGNGSLQTS